MKDICEIRNHRQKDHLIHKAWHKSIPFKFSFITWRLIKSRLPFTNNSVCRFIDMPVDCLCCSIAQPKTIQHFFIEGEPPLEISYHKRPVKMVLHDWWQTRSKNEAHKLIIHVTPIIIYWVLWTTRCYCRYGDQK
ncbi:hypothetical protein K7X08_014400 [Anisodus acutangulus]|uniref:Reverse transcriptase zinc-binding domain-containing protein n=1 Tax=Anisodus acutangulus TaxID=402998 RepID=A0A9Q1LLS7_9SOLA|nr:hypothetical protein K7X08_014400 [Anisodus acutangulus]